MKTLQERLKGKLLDQLPEVEGIHEFHVWRLVGNKVFASVHAMLKHEVCRSDHMLNAKRIKVGTHYTLGRPLSRDVLQNIFDMFHRPLG